MSNGWGGGERKESIDNVNTRHNSDAIRCYKSDTNTVYSTQHLGRMKTGRKKHLVNKIMRNLPFDNTMQHKIGKTIGIKDMIRCDME